MINAYSYVRFSSPEQMSGDSIKRQTSLAAAYAEEFGLRLDSELTYRDLGVSSFRSQNSTSGRLGAFLRAAQTGLVPNGSILLVENLDRLSRDNALLAQNLLTQIVLAGVTIVTLSDRRSYSIAELNRDPMGLLFALINFIRANDESALKSLRMKASWESKRATAASKPMTSRCPRWMTLDKATGRFVLIPNRVRLIRKIFALAADGKSLAVIRRSLTSVKAPLWEHQSGWNREVLRILLRNSSVVGTYRPHIAAWQDGRMIRLTQKPIPNYYPPIISGALFQQVQRKHRHENCGPRGIHANIVEGLARCSRCDGRIARIPHGTDGGRNLACATALDGLGCSYIELPYGRLEAALRHALPSLLRAYNLNDSHCGKSTRAITAQNALDRARHRLSNFYNETGPAAPATSEAEINDLVGDDEAEDLEAALLEAEEEMLEAAESYEQRSTKPVLRQIAHAMECLTAESANSTDTQWINNALRTLYPRAIVDIQTAQVGLCSPDGTIAWIALP